MTDKKSRLGGTVKFSRKNIQSIERIVIVICINCFVFQNLGRLLQTDVSDLGILFQSCCKIMME